MARHTVGHMRGERVDVVNGVTVTVGAEYTVQTNSRRDKFKGRLLMIVEECDCGAVVTTIASGAIPLVFRSLFVFDLGEGGTLAIPAVNIADIWPVAVMN